MGIMKKKRTKPTRALGPSCTSRIIRQTMIWIGAVHASEGGQLNISPEPEGKLKVHTSMLKVIIQLKVESQKGDMTLTNHCAAWSTRLTSVEM